MYEVENINDDMPQADGTWYSVIVGMDSFRICYDTPFNYEVQDSHGVELDTDDKITKEVKDKVELYLLKGNK